MTGRSDIKQRYYNRILEVKRKKNEVKFCRKASPIFTSKSSITTLEQKKYRELYVESKTPNLLRKVKPVGIPIVRLSQYHASVIALKGLGLKDYWDYM